MILFKFCGDAALLGELQFLLIGNGGRQFIFLNWQEYVQKKGVYGALAEGLAGELVGNRVDVVSSGT